MKEVLDDIERWRAAGHRVAVARVVGARGLGPARPGRDHGGERRRRGRGLGVGRLRRGRGRRGGARGPRRRRASGASSRSATPTTRRSRSASPAAAPSTSSSSRSTGDARWPSRSIYDALRDALRAEEPVALATVTAGPELGAKLLVRPDGDRARHARRPRPRPRRRPRRARRARGRPHVDPPLRRARRGARRHGVGVHRVVRAAAADDHLRRGRLHRRAGQGRQGARLPRHRVRRAGGVRHRQRFPMADEVVNEWPDRYLEKVGDDLGPRDAVCVLTHDTQVRRPRDRRRARDRRRLPRRDGLAPHARAAHRAAARGGRRPTPSSPRSCADRPRHRRPHAGGDRGVDLRRDHRAAHRPRRRRCRDDGPIHDASRSRSSSMDLGIEGRRAAVAAASSGLGLATAAALADEGVHGRDLQPLRRERIDAAAARDRPRAVPLVADVVHRGAAQPAFVARRARDALGGVDILVCNGGGPPPGNFASHAARARTAPRSSSTASPHIAMCHEAVPAMREQQWGRVVAITSIAVRQPIAGLILSNTARAGLTALPQDAGARGRGRRRHRELAPARACTTPNASAASTAASSMRRGAGSPPGCSATRGLRPDRGVPVLGAGALRHRHRDPVDGGAYTGLLLNRAAYDSRDAGTDGESADRHGPERDLAGAPRRAHRSSSGCSPTTSCSPPPALLAVLGATDWVDGWIARHFDQGSDLGKVLDPVADRILLLVAAVALIVQGSVPLVVGVLVLVREARRERRGARARGGRRPPHRRAVGRARRARSP